MFQANNAYYCAEPQCSWYICKDCSKCTPTQHTPEQANTLCKICSTPLCKAPRKAQSFNCGYCRVSSTLLHAVHCTSCDVLFCRQCLHRQLQPSSDSTLDTGARDRSLSPPKRRRTSVYDMLSQRGTKTTPALTERVYNIDEFVSPAPTSTPLDRPPLPAVPPLAPAPLQIPVSWNFDCAA